MTETNNQNETGNTMRHTTHVVCYGTTGDYQFTNATSEIEALTIGRALVSMGEDVTIDQGLYPAVFHTVAGQLVVREDIEDELANVNVR